MSLKTLMPALWKPLLLATAALLAVAAPATALLGLPVGLPSAQQGIETPIGSADVGAGEQGADACYDVATPALPPLPATPALPALPVPVPVAVPAVPALPTAMAHGASSSCIHAGLDGASADVGLGAAGQHVGTGLDAGSPVSAEEIDATATGAAGEAQGFFASLVDTLFGWI